MRAIATVLLLTGAIALGLLVWSVLGWVVGAWVAGLALFFFAIVELWTFVIDLRRR